MRISEPIECAGHFWIPEKEDRKVSGILRIKDGGRITLSLIGSFNEFEDDIRSIANNNARSKYDYHRLIGLVDNFGYITIDECSYINRNISFSSGIVKSEIQANLVILGVAYGHKEEIILNKFEFSIEFLEDWLQIKCFNVELSEHGRSVNIEYVSPDIEEIRIQENIVLKFVFQHSIPMPRFQSAKITQRCFIQLLSENAKPLDDFIKISHQITNLLCLSATKTLSIQYVSAYSFDIVEQLGDIKSPVKMHVYYRSRPFSDVVPSFNAHEFLFTYHEIRERFEESINSWLRVYDTLSPVVGLFFTATSHANRSLEGRFLALTQAAETHHRRTNKDTVMPPEQFEAIFESIILSVDAIHHDFIKKCLKHSNEPSLRIRINHLVARFTKYFGNSRKRISLVQKIVQNRNYLTHYDDKNVEKSINYETIWIISLKLEVLIQLLLLTEIGFDDDQIDRVVNRSTNIKRILQM